jgi:hypothetical protein
VVVASPPGAGKTRLVIHLAEQLNRRAGLTIAIATQTRAQAFDVTNRAAAIGARVALLGVRDAHRPMDLHSQAGYLKGAAHLSRWRVVVATTARWLWVNERDYTADVCIVDFSSRPYGVRDVGSHLRSGAVPYGGRTHVRHSLATASTTRIRGVVRWLEERSATLAHVSHSAPIPVVG